ncbi:MAG: ABC transporter ATP-binding protein [Bacteroidales bacterium]|nr:ABC transporter ATP-binding protein [Bacteroidales bacterium]MBN2633332.1 ABC transporter ATP-binding protein [Bacteroidales bacterium]
MIEINDIYFSYNHSPVIKGITHRFEKGSFSAILGPNGSGKTTLIRLLNHILKPLSGDILLNGISLNKMTIREIAREIAYVPQFQYNVFPSTVFDTVLLGRNPYIRWSPGSGDRKITSDILEKLHLSEVALKDINQLSGGQRQRVFIARALAQQPSIIILDEPTANLDIRYQNEVLELLGKLRQAGITIIMAIHDLNQALRYCPEFLIIDDGRIVAEGGLEVFDEQLIESVYKIKVKIFRESGQIYILPR